MSKVTITCVSKDKNEVINMVGYLLNESSYKFKLSKKSFIDLYGKHPLVTKDGTRVHVVKGTYLRTDGDMNANNDLLDLGSC